MDSFCSSSIWMIGSFKNPFATITSLSKLYFRFRKFTLSTNKKSYFYEPWQQHKQLKTMEMSEVWPDTYNEGYIHQFQPEPTHKLTSNSRRTKLKDILQQNISQMITNTISISTKIIISYVMKWCILLWIYWKVNGNWHNNMIRSSQWRKRYCRTNTSIRR